MNSETSTNSLEAAQSLLERAGYVVFKDPGKPDRLPNEHLYDCPYVPAPTLVDYRRSKIIEKTAGAIIGRGGMRALNSKLNWRTLELAFLAVRDFEGEVWEAGVYQGVTANVLAHCVRDHGPPDTRLRLFDTFEGMPETDPEKDLHFKGHFSDTSLDAVRDFVGEGGEISFHKGFIPTSFEGLENSKIKLLHIDLDIYQSILDTLEFCYPRMDRGIIIFDDYGTPSCPGALDAVDHFFGGRRGSLFCFSTGQAMLVKFE